MPLHLFFKKKTLRDPLRHPWAHELLFTLPSFLWLLFFFVFPTLILLDFSFHSIESGKGLSYTLANYRQSLFGGYSHLFLKSFLISAKATIATMVLALPVSYYLARVAPSTRRVAMTAISIPFWTSFLVRIFAWKSLLHPEGFLHQILELLHLAKPGSILLYNERAVLMVMVYTSLPFALFPLINACERLDWQLLEAAQDLGASQRQTMTRVFLPAIEPTLWASALLVFIPNLGSYVIPELIGGVQGQLLGSLIVHETLTARNLPSASALSTCLALFALIIVALMSFVRLGYALGRQYNQIKMASEHTSKERERKQTAPHQERSSKPYPQRPKE